MSIFLLPKGLCLDINSHMRKFWWGARANESRINWMSWDKIGRAKNVGGMGFRDFHAFNMALLAKQGWRLWKNPESLVANIMQAKYYPHGTFLDAKVGGRPSFAWRSILSSSSLIKEGLFWRMVYKFNVLAIARVVFHVALHKYEIVYTRNCVCKS